MIPAKTGLDLFHFCSDKPPFKDWSPVQLASNISKAIEESTLLYTVDGDEITGVCLGQAFPDEKRMHITGIYAPRGTMLGLFYPYFKNKYPDWKLSGFRKKRNKTLTYG